ncbi:TPA: DUF1831 domain-containing protein [Streptococcus suis]
MAFEQTVALKNCAYRYTIQSGVKKYTLRDNTFEQTKVGNYQLTRMLEEVPNSNQGFLLKIIINPELTGFKINITDKSGLKLVDIFKAEANTVIQEKFYFLMESLVDRNIFTKEEN